MHLHMIKKHSGGQSLSVAQTPRKDKRQRDFWARITTPAEMASIMSDATVPASSSVEALAEGGLGSPDLELAELGSGVSPSPGPSPAQSAANARREGTVFSLPESLPQASDAAAIYASQQPHAARLSSYGSTVTPSATGTHECCKQPACWSCDVLRFGQAPMKVLHNSP